MNGNSLNIVSDAKLNENIHFPFCTFHIYTHKSTNGYTDLYFDDYIVQMALFSICALTTLYSLDAKIMFCGVMRD